MTYDNFKDYMYYLLTSPFKRVKKSINNWYILCEVLGSWFDECMNDIYRATLNGQVLLDGNRNLDAYRYEEEIL